MRHKDEAVPKGAAEKVDSKVKSKSRNEQSFTVLAINKRCL